MTLTEIGALVGAITGPIALWHSYRQTQPRLRVEPRFKASGYDQPAVADIAIHVINKSAFEVKIASAAIMSRDSKGTVTSRVPTRCLRTWRRAVPRTSTSCLGPPRSWRWIDSTMSP